MSTLLLTGLDVTYSCLHELRDDIGYLSISEVTDRNRSIAGARVDFSGVGLSPWMKRESTDDDKEEDEEEGEGEDEEEDEAGPGGLGGALDRDVVDTALLAIAARRWIRETTDSLMAGRPHVKFKVGLWTPRGTTLLHSSRFEAKNPGARRREADEEADVEAERRIAAKLPDLTPTVATPPTRPGPFPPEERIWQSLGDGYANLISLAQSTYSHIAKLHGAEIVSLSDQNRRLLGTVESLSSDLRQVHVGTAEMDRAEVRDAGEAKVREELGKQFIQELGSLGRAFAASKIGIPPELADVVGALGASPDLMEALKLPEVRAMLNDEGTLKELAALLKMSAKATAAKPQPATPPPANDPSQNEGGSSAA
jgi:hypothetical protein